MSTSMRPELQLLRPNHKLHDENFILETQQIIVTIVPHSYSFSSPSLTSSKKNRRLVLSLLDCSVFVSSDVWCHVVLGFKSKLQQSRAVCTCSGLPINRQKWNCL